jgi:hypothetical protein
LIGGNSPIVATYRKDEAARNGEAVWSEEVVWSGEAVWIEEGHFVSNHSYSSSHNDRISSFDAFVRSVVAYQRAVAQITPPKMLIVFCGFQEASGDSFLRSGH